MRFAWKWSVAYHPAPFSQHGRVSRKRCICWVRSAGGGINQEHLWKLQQSETLLLHDLTAAEVARVAALMEKYQDTPMDMADASLIAVAESLGLRQILTLDSDFRIYQLADGSMLEILS